MKKLDLVKIGLKSSEDVVRLALNEKKFLEMLLHPHIIKKLYKF